MISCICLNSSVCTRKFLTSEVQIFLVVQKYNDIWRPPSMHSGGNNTRRALACKLVCGLWSGTWGSCNDSGGSRVGFSRPKPIWLICLRKKYIIKGGKRQGSEDCMSESSRSGGQPPSWVAAGLPQKRGVPRLGEASKDLYPPSQGYLRHCHNPLPINTDEGSLRHLLGWNYVAQTKHIKWITAN